MKTLQCGQVSWKITLPSSQKKQKNQGHEKRQAGDGGVQVTANQIVENETRRRAEGGI